MTRLKKKAGARITLYHDTSLSILEQIIQAGQIMPGGYTGNISGGSDITQDGSSADQNAIYLNNGSPLADYAWDAMRKHPRPDNLLNLAIMIRVEVDEDALSPDRDDFSHIDTYIKSKGLQDVPQWKVSLDKINQCAHYGPIFLDEITGICYKGDVECEDRVLSFDERQDVTKIMGRDFVSISEFMQRVAQMDQWWLQLKQQQDEQQNVAHYKNRLKKKAGARITLYHETGLNILEMIIQSGAIMPGGYTGQRGVGNVGEPSGQEDGVYLQDSGNNVEYSYYGASQSRGDNKYNFGVSIRVSVDEDALGPDRDDWYAQSDGSNDPLWRQSLNRVHQCIHYGPVFVDEITGVKGVDPGRVGSSPDVLSKYEELFTSEYYPLDEFMSRVAQFDEFVNQIGQGQTYVASRLRNKRNFVRSAGWESTPRLYVDEGPNNGMYEAGPNTCTAIQEGMIDINDIANLPGRNGEVRQWEEWTSPEGKTYNYFGDYEESKWNEFLKDIKQNGIQHPISIVVEKDGAAKVSEGNHRIQAALQLGLQYVPVEINYMGNSQRFVTQFGLGEGNYAYTKRGWQN